MEFLLWPPPLPFLLLLSFSTNDRRIVLYKSNSTQACWLGIGDISGSNDIGIIAADDILGVDVLVAVVE